MTVPRGELAALLDGERVRFARAPGRVNLIGEHTDYQDGFCVPMAIDREVVVAFAPRDDGRVLARSLDLDGTAELRADGRDPIETVQPAWARTVGAVLAILDERGREPIGFDLAAASSVPVGGGLSSSAAFEVAVALAGADIGRMRLAGNDLALVAQRAEHLASGVPCGVMDQMASVHGRAGHAILLDCRSLAVEPVTLPAADVLVVHSGLPRRLASSAYAERRAACEAAAARLGVPALRDASLADVRDDPIARHVVSENERALAFVDAARSGATAACGELMVASHASLRDDFAVSTPELDLLVELLLDHGAHGARLTGAGFGGCVVALVPTGTAGATGREIAERYGARTGLVARPFAVQAVDGACVEGAAAR